MRDGNKKFQLLKVLKSKKAYDTFKKLPIKFAILFGSLAKGTFKQNQSDVDIAVYIEDKIFQNKKYDYLDMVATIADLLRINKLDLVILNDLHTKNPLLLYYIFKHGKTIYNKNLSDFNKFVMKTYPIAEDEYYFRLKLYNALYGVKS